MFTPTPTSWQDLLACFHLWVLLSSLSVPRTRLTFRFFVRRNSPLKPERRPLRRRINDASLPWPSPRDIPPEGAYLVTTTWRDVIDAAMTVGRDPAPWLAEMPALAWSELVVRWSPLMAYLRRSRDASGKSGTSGYLVEPNAVYREGDSMAPRPSSSSAP